MSELHIEHHNPKRTKKAIQQKGKFMHLVENLLVDMIPVILGILIALSFNSLKEGLKERKEEKYFLERLHYDLKEDLKELKEDAANYRFRKHGVTYLNNIINDPSLKSNRDSAFIYFNNLFGQTAPNITNAAYLTLTGSGKLDIIKNKEIVEGLVKLYTDITVGLKNITGSFNDFKQKHFNEVIYEQFDYANLRKLKNVDIVLANTEIKNALNLLWFDETIMRYETAIKAHEQLMNSIEKEIKN